MDSIKIYSSDGALLIDAVLEDSSAQDWGIMSENQVSLDFYTDECIILPASCYIDYEGQRFWLLDEYKPTENNSAEWSYQVRFFGAESLLAVTVVLNQTDGSDEPIFNLTAPASQHLESIVSDLNRRFPDMGWSVGSVPSTENIFIEYAGTYASEALQTIVGDKYEWWVDDFVINIGRCEFGERIELGYQNGLLGGITYSTANEMRSYAYLYPIGSTRNIDPSKYGYSRLQLPNGLTRIDINPEQGLAELVESDAFADIFPRYVGKVTAVRTSSGKNEDGTSFTIYHIKDSSIPFNPNNYEIAGEVKQITFQSGELMGAEFEVNYDADNKEFEIITQFQNGGLSQLPGGALIPKVGDKYVVWNISMPDEYYPLAEQEFLQAALAFASESVKEASVYRASVDFIEVQQRGLRLRPGQRVRLLSNEYFPDKGYYDSRITRITRDVCYPDEITIEVSSVVSKGTISRLRNSVNDSATKVASLGQSLKNYVDITSAQSIFGAKNFVNGFTLAGVKMYRHVDGYVYLDETLVLKGGVVMYGNSSGVNVPSIFDSLPIDGYTIKRDGNGALYVDETALSVSGGGSGGGVADSVHWNNVTGKPSWIGSTKPSYKYSEIEERPDLSVYAKLTDIPSLNGYATQSWVEGKGYLLATTASSTYQPKITSSNKLAYSLISGTPTIPTMLSQLTDDVVAGNYLSMKGGTINGSITATSFIGNLTGNADSATTIYLGNSNVNGAFPVPFVSNKTVGNKSLFVSTTNTLIFNPSTGGLSAKNFIGDLTGNADSATKLATARTIWGQSFDGTKDVTGAITVDGDATFLSKVVIGGISLRKVDNYLYLDSSLVLSGGVTMYGDDGTTVKPIWESIPLDSSTLAWLDGKLSVIGGVGSGGGISEEFLNVKLQGYQPLLSTTNKLPYSLISGTPTIPTKLSQLADDDVVAGKYLPLAGGTISGDFDINSQTDTTIRYFRMWYYSEGRKNRGMIRVNEDNVALSYYSPTDGVYHPLTIGRDGFKYNTYDILHSGNYSNLLAGGTIKGSITLNNPTSNTTFDAAITLDAKSYGTSSYSQIRWKNGSDVSTRYGYINLKGSSYGHGSGVDIGRINGEDNAVWASITATGITATSFIGNLTGNVTGNVSGSSGSCTGNAASATTVRINNAASNVLCPLIFVSNTTAGNKDLFVSTGKSLTFNPSTGGLSAKNFIGNLTGNADSATKLATARTIWGQSFDGTGNITGAMTVDGDATFSSTVIIGTIPIYRLADGTLFVDANVVFSGSVTMYGNTTTTITEE